MPGGKPLGLGAPELIVILVILAVMYSGAVAIRRSESPAHRGRHPQVLAFWRYLGYAVLFVAMFLAFTEILSVFLNR